MACHLCNEQHSNRVGSHSFLVVMGDAPGRALEEVVDEALPHFIGTRLAAEVRRDCVGNDGGPSPCRPLRRSLRFEHARYCQKLGRQHAALSHPVLPLAALLVPPEPIHHLHRHILSVQMTNLVL